MTSHLSSFAQRIVSWQLEHGRQHLPWQHTTDPYRIWLSEIMLQQTQVSTVLGYYERFLERFPTVGTLAAADQDEVMPYWAGLGYYARARNLHKCAQTVQTLYNGQFPTQSDILATLPGIGPSTAAAIAAFSVGERAPIMDGNVKRVFCRYFGVYGPTHLRATEKQLWSLAHQVLELAPNSLNMSAYTQGQMDLGAQVCTRGQPNCERCPLQQGCYALAHQAQTELPTPKPRPKQDERDCHMLIWQQNNRVLVVQRPNQGIWGGMLSLPQFETAAELQQFLLNHHLINTPVQKMASFTHVFSHFKLHISPWWLQTQHTLYEPKSNELWLNCNAVAEAALPAPVSKLLTGLWATDLLS